MPKSRIDEIESLSILLVLVACIPVILSACGGGGEKSSQTQLGLTIATGTLPGATVNIPYTQTVEMQATGGTSPYVYSCAVSNGSGLSTTVSSSGTAAGSSSCMISGTPLQVGAVTISFSVSDSSMASAAAGPLSVDIASSPEPQPQLSLTIATGPLPGATVNVPYTQTVEMTATGGTSPYVYSCSVSGGTGLSATVSPSGPAAGSASCMISGTPLQVGAATINFSVSDSSMASVTKGPLSVNIVPVPGPLDTWRLRRSSSQDSILRGVTYGNGTFVAVGDNGTILTSVEGITWTTRTSDTANHLYGVAYGNGTFVAVGAGGIIRTSRDGATWTSRISGIDSNLRGVAYGGITFMEKFVVVGDDTSKVLTSSNGTTWTPRTLDTLGYGYSYSAFYAATYGAGKFVILGTGGFLGAFPGVNGLIQTSVDGVNWTLRHLPIYGNPGFSHAALRGVAYGDGIFVAISSFEGKIFTSADGINWSSRTLPSAVDTLNGVTYGNGIFLAVCENGKIFSSANGITWSSRVSGTTQSLRGVTYGNGTFVAVGYEGTIIQSGQVSD